MCLLFLCTQGGYRDVMKLADNFAAFNQRLKYAHYRPSVPVKIDAKSWWKYAYRVVSEQIKIARYLNVNLCFLIDAGFLCNLDGCGNRFLAVPYIRFCLHFLRLLLL